MQAVTLGVDIGKRWFHLIGLGSDGRVVLREKFTREQLLRRFATHPVVFWLWKPAVARSISDASQPLTGTMYA